MPTIEDSPTPVTVAGVPLTNLSPEQAAHRLASLAKQGTAADVHLVNAYTISLLDTEQGYGRVIREAAINFADGKPLTWAARWIAKNRLSQVRGPDLFERVLEIGDAYELRHYLLGGSEETLRLLHASIDQRHPAAEVVGSYSPPFRPLSATEIATQDEQIRASGANIVWVGLGTPKQDHEVSRLASSLEVTAVAVGAAFDFSAGNLRRAPEWMSRAGLEWLFRFAMEPRRLWRRYTVGNVRFVLAVVGSALRSPSRG